MKITETFFGGEDYMYEGGVDITLHTNDYKNTKKYFNISLKRVEGKRKEKDFTVVTSFGDDM